jgi:septal ring factor EnvC (AmiA/AmiB activator)
MLLRGLLKKDVDLAQKKQITNIEQEVTELGNNQDVNYDPAGQLESNLDKLRKAFKKFETSHVEKSRNLDNMNTLLKEMLKGSKRTVST